MTARLSNDEAEADWPSAAHGWGVTLLLCLAFILSWVDRQIFALLIPDIKSALGLSDTAIGLLHGLSFAMLYTLAGLPLGWLVDRTNRRGLVAGAIALWSLATAACGLARGFAGLFVARMAVGVGEAALNPAAVSLISDYFPPKKRGSPLGVFAACGGLGGGLAMLIGGGAIAFATRYGPFDIPLVGRLATWQAAFILVGLPGLVVALLILLVREPVRRDTAQAEAGWRPFFVFIGKSWRFFAAYGFSFALLTLVFFAVMTWAPAFLNRTQGWSAPQVGAALGPTQLLASGLGGALSGLSVDWLLRRGVKSAPMLVMALLITVAIVPTTLAPLLPSPGLTIALWGLLLFSVAFSGGAALTVLQSVTPNRFRGKLVALLFMLGNLVGMGLGPVLLALMNDRIFGEARIGLSLSVMGAAGLLAAAALAWIAQRRYHAFMVRGAPL